MNGDGKPDVGATGPLKNATMDGSQATVLFNNGMSGFFSPGLMTAAGPRPFSIGLADMNHDLKLDMVISNTQDANQSSVTVLLNQGSGAFPAQNIPMYLSGYAQTALALGDVNKT